MLIIKADTPEECKAGIIQFLKAEASRYSIQSRLASKKTAKAMYIDRSKAIEAAANFIEGSIKVMPK